jgi:DNA replication initiation complex subunit (GINS family)
MSEELLVTLQRELENELTNEELSRIDPGLYKAVAMRIKQVRGFMGNGDSPVVNALLAREIGLYCDLADNLLRIRLHKFLDKALRGTNEITLTPEERYMVEPLYTSVKRLGRIREAVDRGQLSVLEESSDSYAVRYIVVRFLQAASKMAGIDLKQYGPYRPEDIAVLPIENAKPLLERGVVVETWVSDR